ncbi:hypothetical protein E2562_032614 [Oryza meyeriana var. granulata]|uniref:Uncharacterized protein n=1 Tax=Oryza meyeriana var. granulata TaxID=110450 RepID=A0A6G1E5J1_9ORYZ|nr:hypothetical protein E2562_032614 [Oryza meyeriana var. granulata]
MPIPSPIIALIHKPPVTPIGVIQTEVTVEGRGVDEAAVDKEEGTLRRLRKKVGRKKRKTGRLGVPKNQAGPLG